MKRRTLVFGAPAAVVGAGMLAGITPFARAAGNVIRFGQSASLSGGQARYGRDVRDGIAAAFAAASKADPHGTRYELVTLDDGGISARCAQNVSTLIEGGCSALIGLTSGPGAEAAMPAVTASQIALLGIASGSMALRKPGPGPLYHVRAGYDVEYKRMVNYVRDFGMRRVGLVRLVDAAQPNLAAMTHALKALSVAPVEEIAVDRNATSFNDVSEKLLAAKLDLVLFTTNAKPIATIIDQMSAARYPGLFYASSFAGQDLLDTLTERKQSCIMSMVVPRPNAGGVSVVNSCRQDLAAAAPQARVGITTLEGYIAGRIAVEAARAALKVSGGERVSRARVRESLAGVRTDLGGYRVEFAPGVTQGSQYSDLIAIDRYGRLVG
jgi:branched-chain amino acid transport system substrate-binding protein